VVGVRVLQQPSPHAEGNLGQWGRESHKKGENKPLHYPSEGNRENAGVIMAFQVLHSNHL